MGKAESGLEETKSQRQDAEVSSAVPTSSSSSSSHLRKNAHNENSLPSFNSMIILCVSIRILLAITIITSFTPDEYYQGVEEAYRIVYKDTTTTTTTTSGRATSIQPTWEWTSEYRIRSYALILPYMALFSIGKYLCVDSTAFVSVGPRVLQGIMASIGDV